MSVTSTQPSPFGHLRREKHINGLCRVSRNEWRGLGSPRPLGEGGPQTSGRRSTGCPEQEALAGGGPRRGLFTGVAAPKGAAGVAVETGGHPRARGDVWKEPGGIRIQGPQPERAGGTHLSHSRKLEPEGADCGCIGLQVLVGANQLCITSRNTVRGLSCHPGRSYAICTRKASKLFVAIEETDCLCLHVCGPARSSCLRLHDQTGQEVLCFRRPYRMDVCCLGCCLMEMTAYTSAGKLLGTVRQRWSMFSPLLEVYDSESNGVLRIQGCWSATRCYADQEFQVTSPAGHPVAVIWKRWPGYNEECNMDHDFFGLDISAALSPCDRALLLAAAFLLNYMFFEMS